ncbi:fumarylacetoacetate hydrolase family protein [Streptomyces yaizuensis]|uniref:Fumarylacetoacetate hydrolase family protein n=1 Tax=Streptomyces yaizuensis TaxID=2989713 RepID=A0ABQ5P1L6_9ACTN|nr:fumarylacetoacetate hydrolase family protein [Streptomyces sp. YSPA8]GLF96507.1 fumarylacetoacetate hydrolase family protein [Streptomyces sp. YSPA8]
MEGQRFVRFELHGAIRHGRVNGTEGNTTVEVLDGDPARDGVRQAGRTVPLDDVRLLSPVQPGKIVAMGRNYADHIAEMGMGAPAVPRLFFKPPSAVIGPGEPIRYPAQSRQVEYEAELAVVIGRTTRGVPASAALSHVFGYTCGNDVTARDIQKADGQPSWAKAFDTFCPLGPWITTGLDPADLEIRCHVNGVLRQHARTSQFLTPVADLIAYISAAVTLDPGDIILTGTPAGVGPFLPGDTVEVSVTGIGTLSNPVVPGTQ